MIILGIKYLAVLIGGENVGLEREKRRLIKCFVADMTPRLKDA
jgi:hypothetical protein